MRKILLATTALAFIGLGGAYAQEPAVQPPAAPAESTGKDPSVSASQNNSQAAGAAAGMTTGAVAGAVVGGPVGAVIGGFAGALIGNSAAVPEPAVQYVIANPVEPVALDMEIREGVVIPETVSLTPIPDQPDYAYVYTNDRPVIVRMSDRQVVYSPGYVLPQQTITYVESNPVEPVTLEGEVRVGATVPADVELRPIPDNPRFSYVYLDRGPAIVEPGSRTVVWVR